MLIVGKIGNLLIVAGDLNSLNLEFIEIFGLHGLSIGISISKLSGEYQRIPLSYLFIIFSSTNLQILLKILAFPAF